LYQTHNKDLSGLNLAVPLRNFAGKFMDLNKIPVFAAITKRMHWLNQRQKLLADNIANSDTPGFAPKDLKELDFKQELNRSNTNSIKMEVSSANHIVPRGMDRSEVKFGVRPQKDVYETSPDGNSVVLEQQLMKVTETKMDYELMTNLYRKHMGMLRTALGRGK
jgi:flagellar basal-body rod protein FlgB